MCSACVSNRKIVEFLESKQLYVVCAFYFMCTFYFYVNILFRVNVHVILYVCTFPLSCVFYLMCILRRLRFEYRVYRLTFHNRQIIAYHFIAVSICVIN